MYIYIYWVASKFRYGPTRNYPEVWIGLDHLRFGMDRGYGSVYGSGYRWGCTSFDSQPYIHLDTFRYIISISPKMSQVSPKMSQVSLPCPVTSFINSASVVASTSSGSCNVVPFASRQGMESLGFRG